MAAASKVAQSFNTFVSETSNVRDVAEKMLYLDENRTVLYTLTNNSKKKVKASSPRVEWFEENDLAMTASVSNGTTNYASNATGILVDDITLFGVGDVVMPTASASASTVEELLLVTAVSGSTNGTITVTRAFAGSTADTIGATCTLKILGVATTENGSIADPRSPARSPKTSACQIFEWAIQTTRTGAATKVYGSPQGDRADKQALGMRRQKLEIENAGLFGRYSETAAAPGSRYTSMGVRSIISTNVTDGGNTLTYQTFLKFSRNAFRYGSSDKLLVAAPIVKEALDYFAASNQRVKPEESIYGVSLKSFITSNGTWRLATNYNMDGGMADEALGIDLPSVEFCYLNENGINLDTKIYEDHDTTNPKIIKDLILSQVGWKVWHQARHSRLYDVADYK